MIPLFESIWLFQIKLKLIEKGMMKNNKIIFQLSKL